MSKYLMFVLPVAKLHYMCNTALVKSNAKPWILECYRRGLLNPQANALMGDPLRRARVSCPHMMAHLGFCYRNACIVVVAIVFIEVRQWPTCKNFVRNYEQASVTPANSKKGHQKLAASPPTLRSIFQRVGEVELVKPLIISDSIVIVAGISFIYLIIMEA